MAAAVAPSAATDGATASILDEISSRAPQGIVLPPRGIRDIVEKTAGYVARNGAAFEDRIRQKQGSDAKTSFLFAEDAYNPYYQWRLEEIKAGRGTNISAGRKPDEVTFQGRAERKGPEPPEEFLFSARMPNISAQDLDVVRLTALFAAKNGKSWITQLTQREAGNFQFDFLRAQHSLHNYFLRMVDQYTELLNGATVDGGRPQKKRLTELEANVKDRFRILDRARKRAEYVKYQEAQKAAKEELDEKEKLEYAQIDWHDFVVVETVVFDEQDEQDGLPAPTTLNDLQSASLEQKAAMSIDPSRRLEEAMPTFDDHEQFYGQAAQIPQAQVPRATYNQYQNDDEQSRMAQLQADRDRARAAQEAAKAAVPLKIRKDYVPAAQARNKTQNTSICPNCKQAIPNDEMENHLRVEMLHPQWREQAKLAQQRSATTNLSTADVANNLKRLASQRTDVFDPITGQAITPEEADRRKRAELQSPSGASPGPQQQGYGAPPPPGTNNVQDQIRQLHQKYRG